MADHDVKPVGLGSEIQSDRSVRILSMDGGGIYGYTTAWMLRWLCEHDPNFLSPITATSWGPGAPWLFAGTSAGALNALVLADQPDPRSFVLSGALEALWHRRDIFANRADPLAAALSWSGVTGWFGRADFERGLKSYFGDRCLGDLEQRVAISAFQWRCRKHNAWHPKVFVNFPADEVDRKVKVWEVAYAAAAPAGLRAIVGGAGDGGVAAPDPTLAAIVEVIQKLGRDYGIVAEAQADDRDPEFSQGFFAWLAAAVTGDNRDSLADVLEILGKLRILSVGVGAKSTQYGLSDFDFGPTLFNLLPTHPAQGNFYPPSWQIGIDAPTDVAKKTAQVLIDKAYHRLSPDLMGPPELPPTLVATMWARFAYWQRALLQAQKSLLEHSSKAHQELKATLQYLDRYWSQP